MTFFTGTDIELALKETGGVVVSHGKQTTFGHFERVPVGALREDGSGEILGAQPSVVIAVGKLTAFGADKGHEETVTVHVPPALSGVLDHPDRKDWVVRDIDDRAGEHLGDGMTIRLMLTEVRA